MPSVNLNILEYNDSGEISTYQLSQSNEPVDFMALLAGEENNNPSLKPRSDLKYKKLSETCCAAFDENLCSISIINTIDKIGQKANGSKSDYIYKDDFEKIKGEYDQIRQQAMKKWLDKHPEKNADDFNQTIETRRSNNRKINLSAELSDEEKGLLKDYVFNNDIDELGDSLKEENKRDEIIKNAQEWQEEHFDSAFNQALKKHSLNDAGEEALDNLWTSAEVYYQRFHTLEGWEPQLPEEPEVEQEVTIEEERGDNNGSAYKAELDEIFLRHASTLGLSVRTVEDPENPNYLIKEFYNSDNGIRTGICTYLGSSQKFAVNSNDLKHYQVIARTAKEQGYSSLNCENFAEASSEMKIMLLAAYAHEGLNVRNFDTSIDYINSEIVKSFTQDTQKQIKKLCIKEMRKEMAATKYQLKQAQERCANDSEYQALSTDLETVQNAINAHPLQIEYNTARRSGNKDEIHRLQKELKNNEGYLNLKEALEVIQEKRNNTEAGIALKAAQNQHQSIFNRVIDIYIKSNAATDDSLIKNRMERLEKIASRRLDKPITLTKRENESDEDFKKRQDAVSSGRYEDLLKQRPDESDASFQKRKDNIRQRHEKWKKDKEKKNRRFEKQNLLKSSIKRYSTPDR